MENLADYENQFVTLVACGTTPAPETFITALIGPY